MCSYEITSNLYNQGRDGYLPYHVISQSLFKLGTNHYLQTLSKLLRMFRDELVPGSANRN